MNNLTDKQAEVLINIISFTNKNKFSPTVRELAELINVSSTATVHTHLKNLVKKGYITYLPKTSRTIRVIKEV